jgi:hypothetical protein
LRQSTTLPKTTFDERFDYDKSLIYHYCDEIVLRSILSDRKFWLSDIYKLNDRAEFEWGRKLFIHVLKRNKNLFEQEFRFYIIFRVLSAKENTLPFIGCFSKNGDLLSQWRAYTNDASGFSIGFSSNLVVKGLGVNLNSIIYDKDEQYNIVLASLIELHKNWLMTNRDYQAIDFYVNGFAIDLLYLKNPTFFEEQEIRITRLIIKDENENLRDVGGNSEIKKIDALPILSRRGKKKFVNYVELPLEIPNQNIIKEIILGPKNEISVKSVKTLLTAYGMTEVKVKKSKSTYR